MTEIEQLKNDIASLFKYLHLDCKIAYARNNKNAAIRVQNFEMASKYRDEEKELVKQAAEASEILNEIAIKYVPDWHLKKD